MNQNFTLTLVLLVTSTLALGQEFTIFGRVTNIKMEPLAFVSIQFKDFRQGIISKEDGTYSLKCDPGKYDLVISIVGYKPQIKTVIVQRSDYELNLVLEEDNSSLSEVVVKGRIRDRSEEIIRNVIRNKEKLKAAAGAWSANLYIKAIQEDSLSPKRKKKNKPDTAAEKNPELQRMVMSEIVLKLDYESPSRIKEQRIGVTKRGNANGLFYLSSTDGDFNFYNNLVNAPALSQTPFLSPFSYSGILAYRYKIIKTEKIGNRKIYTISVKPGKLSNSTVEGEVVISDSSWVVLHTNFKFPGYHLPQYDEFEIEQEYSFVNNTAWMIVKQQFSYYSKAGKGKRSGMTTVMYKDFELNKLFPPKYFGSEVSATALEAYEKDSLFWQKNRSTPLTEKEYRFIQYKDSIYRVTHTKQYLDSVDHSINRITWQNILFKGQTFNDHEKERRWYLPPLPSIYQPFQFGGSRINLSFAYSKKYTSKRNINVYTDLSYGIRNHDVNGAIRFNKLYNPFNRGFYSLFIGRSFEYIFQGDAWINMLKRSNIYLNNGIGIGHGLELANGLFLYTDFDMSFRRSVSNYKINAQVDSLFGDLLTNNNPIQFEPYNAVYGKIRLQYTPHQRYIREPREKIILGSKWPTFYTMWRKGIPGVMGSRVNFDYLEFGMEQQIKIGLAGISNYNIKTGTFLNTRDLRLVDYQFQRRGDPLLFMNPNEAFQALDSTFAVFNRFYQAHYVHEMNGALLNKLPLLKKLQLRELIGAGFLIARERNLRYVEVFAGIERVFKWPFNPETKFKLGVYVVGSAANNFKSPVQFKVGITSWDKRRNKWF